MDQLRDATVHQMLSWNREQIHWNLSLVRSPNDWEEESVCNLFAKLAAMEGRPQGDDELAWPHDRKGSFSVKSFCNALKDRLRYFDFLSVAIWRSKVPPKSLLFCLAANKAKVPAEDFLKRRNCYGPSRCALCLEEEESVHHLFVHCRLVSSLWHLSLSLMGVSWVQHFTVKDVLVA